jgi:hypothetical protein
VRTLSGSRRFIDGKALNREAFPMPDRIGVAVLQRR